MRRNDREITDLSAIEAIIRLCKTCHVGMIDGDTPYVVPLSFGYEVKNNTLTLYFHSAKEGRKLDILRRNNRVCFEMCVEQGAFFSQERPCGSGQYFASVIGFGEAEPVDAAEEKRRALSLLMERQFDARVSFAQSQADTVCVFKITSTDFTGKQKARPHP